MKVKNNEISLVGLKPEMRLVLKHVENIYKTYGQEAVITAGTEATKDNKFIHSAGSYHPFGYALDFRTYFFSDNEIKEVQSKLSNLLGSDYDVIFEGNHFHIEFNYK